MNKIIAIVPARENETGKLINKDILPFGDSNLLIHKIRQLKQVNNLKTIVSTESQKIAAMVEKESVEVIYRPKNYARADTPFGELVRYVCNQVEAKHILWTCATSPLVTASIYEKVIGVYMEKLEAGYDSLVSVQKLQRYLMDKNGALNFQPGKKLKPEERLPELYIFTNGISIAPRKEMLEWQYTSGDIPYMYELDKKASVDICDMFDYQCAKIFYEKDD